VVVIAFHFMKQSGIAQGARARPKQWRAGNRTFKRVPRRFVLNTARGIATACPLEGTRMSGQGSTGNVIAALASFFIPGLGQLIQGRLVMAIIQFLLAGVLWIFLLGWLVHLWSIIDAALWKPRAGLA
jgi:TM2 domain-containing membrane protein YozV